MLDKKLLSELQEFVNSQLENDRFFACEPKVYDEEIELICEQIPSIQLENFIKNNRKPSFSQVLFGFIDKKELNDSDIYKKAGVDRRHFSKIRSNPDYHPGKNTAIALALALKLNKNEFDKLLGAAGYSLSGSDMFDLVIQFCVERKIYDMDDVNEALGCLGLEMMG
jgi:hypothetical protein